MTAYAEVTDLETWLDQASPDAPSAAVALRMLARASELIDDYTRTAIYPTDVDGLPTEADDIAALRDAVCAQVEFWFAGDEEDDILGPVDALQLGSLKVNNSQAGGPRVAPLTLAPRAARILRNAGLYAGEPVVW